MGKKERKNLEKTLNFLKKIHDGFMEFLKLPPIDFVILDKNKSKNGKDVVGEFEPHEFYPFTGECIYLYLRDGSGNYFPDYVIFDAYFHEVTHYHLYMNSRNPGHGKEFDRRKEMIYRELDKFVK